MSYFMYENTNIFYKVAGHGEALVIVHGDTASSKMLMSEMKFYSRYFKVIMVDLLGQGKSERMDQLPLDYWNANADMIIGLCTYLGCENVNILGTSGGAIVALNAVLKRPDFFSKIIADSFLGEYLSPEFARNIVDEREVSKRKVFNKVFWHIMHGSDWKNVIDQNSKMLLDFSQEIGVFFFKDIKEIRNKVLITASKEDDLISEIESTLNGVSNKIENSDLKLFSKGNHPAILSNRKEFRKIAIEFLIEE